MSELPTKAEDKMDTGIAKSPATSEAEKTLDQKIRESWEKRSGDLSEVVDSEGHRVHINHY